MLLFLPPVPTHRIENLIFRAPWQLAPSPSSPRCQSPRPRSPIGAFGSVCIRLLWRHSLAGADFKYRRCWGGRGWRVFGKSECWVGKYHHLISCMKSGNIALEFLEFWLYGQNQIKRSVCYSYHWPFTKLIHSWVSSSLLFLHLLHDALLYRRYILGYISLQQCGGISPQNHLQNE